MRKQHHNILKIFETEYFSIVTEIFSKTTRKSPTAHTDTIYKANTLA